MAVKQLYTTALRYTTATATATAVDCVVLYCYLVYLYDSTYWLLSSVVYFAVTL